MTGAPDTPRIEAPWLQDGPATAVCAMLTEAGHQAWFVGGCVRNALLGEPVADLDISTDARPDRVLDLARSAGLKSVPTGADHGTITVIADGKPFEVTTFRKDVETDGRRAIVAFADTLEEDARRRDFTMNALYAAPDGTLADPICGLPDLRARHLRFIGNPEARIREDYLRILRFFRFHAWYGGDGLDPDGLAACAALAEGIEQLSRERIGHEMRRLLAALDPAPAVAAMEAAGVLMRVMPGAGAGRLAVLVHLEGEAGAAPDWLRRLAALGGPDPGEALRLSKAEARGLAALMEGQGTEMSAGELGYRLGLERARDVLLLRAAVMVTPWDPEQQRAAEHGAGQSFPLKAADLADRHSGPDLGRALREAESRWIASGFTLDRDALLR